MPRIAALLMLRSTIETVSAPAISPFRGSITHPTQSLCTLRGRRCRRLTQHSLPGGLLGLTWAGLAPADRASFLGAFLNPGYGSRRKPEVEHVAVGDHVVLAFQPHLAGIARPDLAAERRIVVKRNGLGADEAALEIGVDHAGRLRRL